MKESIEMEMVADYTSNADYMKTWTELMNDRDKFMEAIEDQRKPTKLSLGGFGEVEVGHLRQHVAMAEQAFDMRMRITAYWRSVVLRLVDNLALHIILYSVNCLVEKEMEMQLVDVLVGPRMSGLERMLEESPSTAGKRKRLRKSIQLLKESKEVVAKDRIEAHGDKWLLRVVFVRTRDCVSVDLVFHFVPVISHLVVSKSLILLLVTILFDV